jgi:3-hydroxy-3-methylglutaryl CoA synthase
MAVEAARDCLTGLDRAAVQTVVLSSTSAPNADRQNAGIVKEALNLADATGSFETSGGMRAGTSALLQMLNAAKAGQTALCVASEKRNAPPASEGELVNGDAAAALLVGPGDAIARHLGSHSVTVDFVDHFRAAGEAFDYGWESRWVRDEGYNKIIEGALKSALAELQIAADKVDHLIIPVPAKGVGDGIAKKLGIRAEAVSNALDATIGYAGSAHPALMLASVLERARPGEIIVMASFGQGCDVVAFEVTEAIANLPRRDGVSGWLARRAEETNYLKFLSFNGNLAVDRGMRAEADFKQPLTVLYRNRKTVLGLVGGRCTKTGTIQFPKTDISVSPNSNAVHTQEDYPLAELPAKVLTYTADNLTYSPNPPAYYGMVEFAGGGRMMAEFAEIGADGVEVGCDMRMMFRIKSVDELRGFTKYFWKAAPVT